MNKLNRIKRCGRCPYFAVTAAWKWPRCYYGHDKSEPPEVALELSDQFMGDPASECPAGFWKEIDHDEAVSDFVPRRRACATCEWFRQGAAFDQHLCVYGGCKRVLDAAMMTGPASNCPAGKWAELKPEQMTLTAEQRDAVKTEKQVKTLGPILRRTLADTPDYDERLARLVEDGRLSPEAATEISLTISKVVSKEQLEER